MSSKFLLAWQQAERLLAARRYADARSAYESLLADPDWIVPAHLRLSAVSQAEGRQRDSVAHALAAHAHAAREDDAALLEALCRRLLDIGEIEAGLACASSPVLSGSRDPAVLVAVAGMMSDFSFTDRALTLLRRARALGADSPSLRYRMGLSEMYAGDLDAAEHELEACLAAAPGFAPAHRELARLRRQTRERNHVDRLRAAIARLGAGHADAPVLHYALFKELDDLGDAEGAWEALSEGMRLRRRQVVHDAAAEQALFDHLQTVAATAVPGADDEGPVPIFIVGMPRSGTTLLERILGAHPQVADAGELRDFTCQLRWTCDCVGGPHLDLELARRAERIDPAELGRRYLSHTRWWAKGRAFYTDKLPTNFANVGYIARALPRARILHMVRDPMDTCFSNLKELFAGAYPHSYDQREMAGHFIRYRRLMAHWHAAFPGRILDVHYDALVADPERVARQVLDFCGLAWMPGMVDIHRRRGAVATASTAQVREPIHNRFVGQWRRYETHLAPMRRCLEAAR